MRSSSSRVKRLDDTLRQSMTQSVLALLDEFTDRSRTVLTLEERGAVARGLRQAGVWDADRLSPELRALWRRLFADNECRRAWLAVETLARMDTDGSMTYFRRTIEQGELEGPQ